MKKILATLLAAMLMLSLAACSSAGTEESAAPSESAAESAAAEASAAPAESAAAETTGGDNVLTMATNAAFPPYEYYENEQIVGIDAEIAAAVAEKLGMTLQIEDMEFGSIIAAVQTGKVSMGMAGMTVTDERLQSVSFSTSYATGIQSVIVAEDSPIASVDDLYVDGATYTVGVQQDTTGDIYITDDSENPDYNIKLTVERYNKGADAVQALLTGKVDCVIIDDAPAKSYVAANQGLKILDTSYAVEDYAICVAKENTALLDQINTALDALIADGTVASIVSKYIPAE